MAFDIKNSKYFGNKLKLVCNKKSGIVLACCVIGLGSLYGNSSDRIHADLTDDSILPVFTLADDANYSRIESFGSSISDRTVSTSIDEINSLNIIINDDECMDKFINSVCMELENDGIKYSFSSSNKDVDVNNAVIITLDQQFIAGPKTAIIAPYDNSRRGSSDALAFAIQSSFENLGINSSLPVCGKIGFRENPDGSISERVPSKLEECLSKENNSSFVSISLGTQQLSASDVAKGIKNGLARYCSFIRDNSDSNDLIYCLGADEDINLVAEHFGISPELVHFYNYQSSEFLPHQGDTIYNPVVKDYDEFNSHSLVSIKNNQNAISK